MSILRDSTRVLTRPVRRLYLSRQKSVRDYEFDEKIVIQLGAGVDLDKAPWIRAALAFTPSNVELIIVNSSNEKRDIMDMAEYVEYYRELKVKAVLFLGETPEEEQIDAFKLLQIAHRVVDTLVPPQREARFPEDNPKRGKWIEAIDRRHVIYAHMDRHDNLERVLEAVRDAQKSFPDLLLILSGIREKNLPNDIMGFAIGKETDELKNLNYYDILLLNSNEYQPLISSIATVQLITPCRNLRAIAKQAIDNATAVAFYDVRPKSLGDLSELVSSGTIWSVRKRDALGSALAQVLDIDTSANTVSQTISRLTNQKNSLIDALDELLALERAA